MRVAFGLLLAACLASRLGLSGLAGGEYGEFTEDAVRANVDRYLHAIFCQDDSNEAHMHAELRAQAGPGCPRFEVRAFHRPPDVHAPFLLTVRSRSSALTLDLTHARTPEAAVNGLVQIIGVHEATPIDH